jgi:hypothetical protein
LKNLAFVDKDQFIMLEDTRHKDRLDPGSRLRILAEIPEREYCHSLDVTEIHVSIDVFRGSRRTGWKLDENRQNHN